MALGKAKERLQADRGSTRTKGKQIIVSLQSMAVEKWKTTI